LPEIFLWRTAILQRTLTSSGLVNLPIPVSILNVSARLEIQRLDLAAPSPTCNSTSAPLAYRQVVCYILNHMVQYTNTFDASFGALSDATRRGVLQQLGRADASITELAEMFQMTLTGMKKHVGVLEQAGLVTTEKVGRVRTCKLGFHRLEQEAAWIEGYRELWNARFDGLDVIVEELKRKEKIGGLKKKQRA
jgi:DNA-binding transcriptional ArsR family regulator